MKFEMFSRVALKRDFAEQELRKGDVATIVERHAAPNDGETGYSLEVFNALGETITVLVVAESEIEPLWRNEILHVRKLERLTV